MPYLRRSSPICHLMSLDLSRLWFVLLSFSKSNPRFLSMSYTDLVLIFS
ncbi:MAG: hypothetical protein IKP53_00650 [Candidatus Methanomethylophilaceae archaeon]|nr:hypothetical protein [Candidatus Methanomethylophilaceae archaeon]